ncbi:unnamed protein product [Lepeophtheirus salmonis]|uniref:(salmon louse) hypothetical protein n=1 Tax=Lepeophtheirus salmonis TaxID=72036 RepID=A0A7R8GYX7_LEPSM|nr:unnamed protein product [Lepeophtheirus salmonis]CAF2755584.1 unnamed protein product [Lepeophtheirus salmonis]
MINLHFSACNRTYYGEVGRSYRLSIPRPRANKLPFICDLHFVAKHDDFGDLIQICIDSVAEKEINSGQFCGIVSKSIRPVYISEKNEVTAALRFFKFYGGETPERNFAFRIKYKFLRLSRAHSRIQSIFVLEITITKPHIIDEEEVVENVTSITQIVHEEHVICALQTILGYIPRNSSCNYRIVISPNEVPKGQTAFISVSQPSHFKTHVLTSPKKKNGLTNEEASLGLFDECHDDSVTIHDGMYETDPECSLFFRSSPFGVPDMEPFTSNGFELRVNVLFKNQGSILAAPIKEECRFTIRSGVSPPSGVHDGSLSSGVIENVIHRLVSAKNRSCYYEFQGNSDEVLWITFLMFKVSYDKKKIHRQNSHDCIHRITLQDNEDHSTILTPTTINLYHKPSFNRHKKKFHFRNCWRHWNESYVSRSSKFTLIETLSLLHSGSTLNFKFRYEFVDVGQGGNAVKRERKVHFINENRNREPLIHRSPILHRDSLSKPEQEPWIHSDHSRVLHSNQHDFIKHNIGKSYEMEVFPSCHRVFNSNASSRKRKKKFFSTKNVFFFGRGSGQKDLQCSYTFQGRPGERILLRINRLNLYNHEICNTIPDPYGNINHFVCSRNSTHGTISEIRISEIPDQKGISLTQFCLCGTGEGNFLSNTSTLRLDLIVSGMTPFTDYSQFLVEGSYEFMHEPVCRLTKIISGQPAGKIEFYR